jgi:hypothetical protein
VQCASPTRLPLLDSRNVLSHLAREARQSRLPSSPCAPIFLSLDARDAEVQAPHHLGRDFDPGIGPLCWILAIFEWALDMRKGFIRYPTILLLCYVGRSLMDGMLTSEFVRKTQLESDPIAARQIQQMLIPQALPELSGYKAAMFYNFCEKSGVIVLM